MFIFCIISLPLTFILSSNKNLITSLCQEYWHPCKVTILQKKYIFPCVPLDIKVNFKTFLFIRLCHKDSVLLGQF